MIIFLYGADSYRSHQKLSEIIDHYKKSSKSGLNLIESDANTSDFADFFANCKIAAMFSEKKLIIVKNLFSNKKFQEDFLEEMKVLEKLDDVIVVYEDTEVDQRLKIFKTFVLQCKSQEFNLLSTKSLETWAHREFEKYNQKITQDALMLLISYVGDDLWRLSEEIKKLVNFKGSAGIKREDVELLVRPRLEIDIFKTIDALSQKNKKQALALLQKHLDAGDEALYLISMITYQLRNLLIIKDLAQKGFMYASIVKKSGLHPFVVKKNYFACQQFSLEELHSLYYKIFQIDLDIKRGKIESETALNILVSYV